jgi:hypothetical protein
MAEEFEKILYEFDYDGAKYLADIRHYFFLTEEERKAHLMQENCYLVHLFSLKGSITFEIYIRPGGLTWVTKSQLIDPEIVHIIGDRIDDIFM